MPEVPSVGTPIRHNRGLRGSGDSDEEIDWSHLRNEAPERVNGGCSWRVSGTGDGDGAASPGICEGKSRRQAWYCFDCSAALKSPSIGRC